MGLGNIIFGDINKPSQYETEGIARFLAGCFWLVVGFGAVMGGGLVWVLMRLLGR